MGKKYTPTVNGRASICAWSLTAEFLTHEQCEKFIKLMIQEDAPYTKVKPSFTYEPNDLEQTYCVEIHTSSWANNLSYIAMLLEQCDYEMD